MKKHYISFEELKNNGRNVRYNKIVLFDTLNHFNEKIGEVIEKEAEIIILNNKSQQLHDAEAILQGSNMERYVKAIQPDTHIIGRSKDIRQNDDFIRGYHKGNAEKIVPKYSHDMTMTQLVDLFVSDELTNEQKGAIAWEIEFRGWKFFLKPSIEKVNQLFDNTVTRIDPHAKATKQMMPQIILVNLANDGHGGRCDPLSKLVLVAKQLESDGQIDVAQHLLEKMFSVAEILDKPKHYSGAERYQAHKFMDYLAVLHRQNPVYLTSVKAWIEKLDGEHSLTIEAMIEKVVAVDPDGVPVLLELDSPIHAMAAWAKGMPNERVYGFYDPTIGIVEFSSPKQFKAYITQFFSAQGLDYANKYHLTKNKNHETVFNRVYLIDGKVLAAYMPKAGDKTTLKDILYLPIFDEQSSLRHVHLHTRQNRADALRLLYEFTMNKERLDHLNEAEQRALLCYFADDLDKLDIGKIKIAIDDPLISRKVNQFFHDDYLSSIDDAIRWSAIFEENPDTPPQQKAADIHYLLSILSEKPERIYSLSDSSKKLLKSLFPTSNSFNRGEIATLINDPVAFIFFNSHLESLIGLDQKYFIGESAPYHNISLSQISLKLLKAQHYRTESYTHFIHLTNECPVNSHLDLIDFGTIHELGVTGDIDLRWSLLYGALREYRAIEIIHKAADLKQKKYEGIISSQQSDLLNKIQEFYEIDQKNLGVKLQEQSINPSTFDLQHNRTYLLMGTLTHYALSYQFIDGYHDFSFFDPSGVEFKIRNRDIDIAKKAFDALVTKYFNEEITQPNRSRIKRGILAGFETGDDGYFKGTIQKINYSNEKDDLLLLNQKNKIDAITGHSAFHDVKNSFIIVHDQMVPIDTLVNLGAVVDGEPINSQSVQLAKNYKNIYFDSVKLSAALMMVDSSEQDLALLKIIRQQIDDVGIYKVTNTNSELYNDAVLIKQLEYIKKNIKLGDKRITPQTREALCHLGMKLPRYAQISNRFGQGIGGVGVILSLTNLYTLLKKLEDPHLSTEDSLEIKKNIYLLSSAAFFNYGDMIIHPILLELSYAKLGTYKIGGTMAAKVVILFNLVGIGLDIYHAYDALSKSKQVTDANVRKELLVSAMLSIGGATVGCITIVGIMAGSATVPVIGLAIGSLLLLGGMVYNGVKAVERIEEEIPLSFGRRIIEGLRGAFGFAPTETTQYEIKIKRYIDAFKIADWEIDLSRFELTIFRIGFDKHLSAIESPILEDEPQYYLVDNDGEYFGGTLGYAMSSMTGQLRTLPYTKDGAPTFNAEDAEFLLSEYVLFHNGDAVRKSSSNKGYTRRFNKKLKENFPGKRRIGSDATHEVLVLNKDYRSDALEKFKRKYELSNKIFDSSFNEQLNSSHPAEWRLFSLLPKFSGERHPNLLKDIHDYSVSINNDNAEAAAYILSPHLKGNSFNTANGNDVIIGALSESNSFQIFSGEKVFVGGNENDYFYLREGNLDALLLSLDQEPSKYLDGLNGNDSLIIQEWNVDYNMDVDLSLNCLNYHHSYQSISLNVAQVNNIENVIIQDEKISADTLRGNSENNFLDGGRGQDTLYGESGNDTLLLEQGYANGGDGKDYYVIRRFKWWLHVNDLYIIQKKYDRASRSVTKHPILNNKYAKSLNQSYAIHIVIDESNKSESLVNLEYSLKEIEQVYIKGTSLIIDINMRPDTFYGNLYPNVSSLVKIELKNVYSDTGVGLNVNHRYALQTYDGFLLNSLFDDIPAGQSLPWNSQLMGVLYSQYNDKLVTDNMRGVDINESESTILVNKDRLYHMPSWGVLLPSGQSKSMNYVGDNGNNRVVNVGVGNVIYVSSGQDVYQLGSEAFIEGEIIFDFSRVQGRYTKNDRVIILLQDKNGYELSMENQSVLLRSRFGQQQLAIRFRHFDETMGSSVLIQDKYRNVFKVELQLDGCQIIPLVSPLDNSEISDAITIPTGYQSKNLLIEGLAGNDILTNMSNSGLLLHGGEDNDILSAAGGRNIMYGAEGENYLYGSEYQDFLLSDKGKDTLMGEKGDDHYLITGLSNNEVLIEDEWGNNHVHLVGFNSDPIPIIIDGAQFDLYTSRSGRIVNVKRPLSASSGSIQVHHYTQLPHVPSDGDLEPLVSFLADSGQYAKRSGLFADWYPVDALDGVLNGTKKPLLVSPNDDGIVLSQTSKRDNWFIDVQEGNDTVYDDSGHGRIIKGGAGNDKLVVTHGNNILYGGLNDDQLIGGGGHDLLISLKGKDTLLGGGGNDIYFVDGKGVGDVFISDTQGNNLVYLIDFNKNNKVSNVLDNNTIESVYTSNHGRQLTIRHQQSYTLMNNSINVYHYPKLPDFWGNTVENAIDNLMSAMVSQRIEVEQSMVGSPDTADAPWQPTLIFSELMKRA